MNLVSFNRNGRKAVKRVTTPSTISVATKSQSSPEDNDTLDLSSTEYARMRREMMQLVNDLRSLGAETMIDLPSVVVIGGQSAGKSSLVEAVSGVNVPRDSGTCTRCPMQCTMSSSATTWSCTIKLGLNYDSHGSPLSQPEETAFGPIITNKDDVDIWLRRAQAAILHPHITRESFHEKNVEELKNFTSADSLKFSRNTVLISIKDPNATDISFVDLPGLIHNEDEEVIKLVQQLTEGHISNPNTIILVTIPMTDEMENQQSVRLANDADPHGERTIGILTKPDILGDGAIQSKRRWLDVIEGRMHILKHGYYCVRLPDDTQRGQRLARSTFQRFAADYFNTTSPWNEVTDRGRFGIPAFVKDVSVLFVNHIKRLIPELKQNVDQLLASCLEEMGTLPKPLDTDPQIEVLLRVNKFCDAFKGAVLGTSSDKRLAQRNRAHYTTFAQRIRGTSPDFRPFEQPENHIRVEALDAEERNEVRDESVQIMGVRDVRETILESIAWELPGNIPYTAKTRLINKFTMLWSTPAENCLASINDVLDDVIQQLVETHFGQFTVLRNLISDLIRPDIEEYKATTLAAVKETLKLENHPIYTLNETDFRSFREKWLGRYKRVRRKSEEYRISPSISVVGISHPHRYNCEPPSSPESQALSYLAQAGYRDLTVDDLGRLSPRDQFEDELVVMADVRAYFTIACKRIVDHVPLKIHQSLHLALADKLSVSLLQYLIVDTNATGNFADRMGELVAEDPAIEAKRTRLGEMRTRLQEMKKKLASFAA